MTFRAVAFAVLLAILGALTFAVMSVASDQVQIEPRINVDDLPLDEGEAP